MSELGAAAKSEDRAQAKKRGFLGSTFDWRLDEAELEEQVSNYSTLGVGKSYRKASAMLWLFTVAITALIGPWLLHMDVMSIVWSTVIYSLMALFCFRGQRWAFIASIVLWTIEKGFSVVNGFSGASPTGGSAIMIVFWWAWYVGTFWKALTVERMRRKFVTQNSATG